MSILLSSVSSENGLCEYSGGRVCIYTYLCINTYFFKRVIFFIFFIFLKFYQSMLKYNNVNYLMEVTA